MAVAGLKEPSQLAPDFNAAGGRVFGSGWVFVTVGKDGKLAIETRPGQDNPMMDGKRALLGERLGVARGPGRVRPGPRRRCSLAVQPDRRGSRGSILWAELLTLVIGRPLVGRRYAPIREAGHPCASLCSPNGAAGPPASCAPVAQGIERLPPEQKAAGSNPAGGTT